MNWNDFNDAFRDARRTMEQADNAATDMARILRGRLRKVSSHDTLAALKKELSQYNAQTGKWKEQQ